VRTVGVDLAAEPEKTGLAVVEWETGGAVVREVRLGVADPDLLEVVDGADKAGFDCPLGWPQPFVDFVTAHSRGDVTAPADLAGRDWRRQLANRATDIAVRQLTGLVPLSVSTDRIGLTAIRAAGLLGALAAAGRRVDRSGQGVVVEVYPAAALKTWGFPYRGYKGPANAAALGRLVDRLVEAAPWLALGAAEEVCRRSDDAFDAVVCALVARAAARGLTGAPGPAEQAVAATEGWIAVPTADLAALR
jgi:predicted nuclease with RNAse H fold